MGIMRLDIVSLQVRDWKAAVRWYTEVLGLAVGPYEEEHQFCMLKTREGDVMLALACDHPEFATSQGENR
jgi:catechol 2,3-dioxygenase-like lactoylglutathione lyase family enzyme